MNDPLNFSYYVQLILFRDDLSRSECFFDGPDRLQQRIIQCLAHELDLEFEYSSITRVATITRARSESGPCSTTSDEQWFDFDRASGSVDAINGTQDQIFPVDQPLTSPISDLCHNDLELSPLPLFDFNSFNERLGTSRPQYLDSSQLFSLGTEASNPGDMYLCDTHPPESFQDSLEDIVAPSCTGSNRTSRDLGSPLPDVSSENEIDEYGDVDNSFGSKKGFSLKAFSARPRRASVNPYRSSSRRNSDLWDNSSFSSASASGASISSASTTSSRRSGPLSSVARTAMRAVKAVGACWRCKILRKSVSTAMC
jgi:hypothetical protein